METSPAARPLTSRFISGMSLAEGASVTAQLNRDGFLVALDHLGENVTTEAEATAARDTNLRALDEIAARKLASTISVKLTQFGLDLGDAICLRNVQALAARARDTGTRVEIDMEDSSYTDRTLAIVRELHAGYGCVRAVIQAYLHRTGADLADLNQRRIPVRICKGAYREPASAAVQTKAEVDERYARFVKLQLEEGAEPAVATHDDRMIDIARAYPKDRFEFQMLYGVRRDRQRQLALEGYRMRLYVPYGEAWYPYFMRRLAERPANVWFVARSLMGG
jgi:proline dehydrogenase